MKYRTWDSWINIAKEVYEKEGSINVPVKYFIRDIKFGEWVSRQRTLNSNGHLKESKIETLESLGICWNGKQVLREKQNDDFFKWIELVRLYKKQYGNTHIPNNYIINGKRLGDWARNIRNIRKGKHKRKLSHEHLIALQEVGFEFNWYDNINRNKWEEYYSYLKDYISENPDKQVYDDVIYKNKKIGRWLHSQRQSLKRGKLSNNRKEMLLRLGINFTPMQSRWNDHFEIAKKYYEEFGSLDIPNDMVIDNVCIGAWISNQRQIYSGSRKDLHLTSNQIEKLNSIGMIWKANGASNTSFSEQALLYYLRKLFHDVKNRNLDFGFELDIYIPSRKLAIEYDGFYWHRNKIKKDNIKDIKCKQYGIKLIRIREHGLPVTKNAVCYFRDDNNSIASLEKVFRDIFKKEFNNELICNIKRDMFEITQNFKKFASKSWHTYYKAAKHYYLEHGNLLIPIDFVTENGLLLGRWIANQRQLYKRNVLGKFTDKEINLLEQIGMIWNPKELLWEKKYNVAKQYYIEHGHLNLYTSQIYHGIDLGKWIRIQRNAYNVTGRKRISKKHIDKLEKIGMIWRKQEYSLKWYEHYCLAVDFYNTNGNLLIPKRYVMDNFKIGEWIQCQRKKYNKQKLGEKTSLSEKQIKMLESIGMVWKVK